jgi:nucleoside-diphosphate-sugar epimerase
MVGRKLTDRLVADGKLGDRGLTHLTLSDVIEAAKPQGFAGQVETPVRDLSTPGAATKLAALRPDVIFHLAAIVSGEAEADFDKGYRINLDSTRALFEAIRQEGLKSPYTPRVVFTSSIAVFGAPFPEKISDEFIQAPLTSYGAQKTIDELLLSDYSRKGFFDGVGIRLPTICIRPGKPNKAASGFFSGIIREPLAGQEAVLPVPEATLHTHASPRAAVSYLIHAAGLPREKLGNRINLTMPGVCCTVAEQIAALRRIAGEAATKRIRPAPDELVARIVAGWPHRFDARRALALGFRPEKTFDEIIHIHIEEDLGGKIAA